MAARREWPGSGGGGGSQRQSIFAPCRQLGLIVIDEEHENSFKQETTPRYHARDVAVMRARLENIPIILGSATPSLESWRNAERGHYSLLKLPKRVLDFPMPPVHLIDLRHEPPPRGRFRAISHRLERAMHEALRENGQVILLLNRRGYATIVQCPSCGQSVEMCKHCDLALTASTRPATFSSATSAATNRSRPNAAAFAARTRFVIKAKAPKSCRQRSRRSFQSILCGGLIATACGSAAATNRCWGHFARD